MELFFTQTNYDPTSVAPAVVYEEHFIMDLELTKLAFSKMPIITTQYGALTLISPKLSSFTVEGNLAGRSLAALVRDQWSGNNTQRVRAQRGINAIMGCSVRAERGLAGELMLLALFAACR